jgi:hypothetical protein
LDSPPVTRADGKTLVDYTVGLIEKTRADELSKKGWRWNAELFRWELWADPTKEKPIEGWESDYYKLPPGASELEDLIEYRNMNFNEGNIFKAIWRKGRKAGVNPEYDLYKIIHFAMRELKRLGKPLPPMHPALHGTTENTN